MQIPIFTEPVDECLNVIEPDENAQQVLDLSLTSTWKTPSLPLKGIFSLFSTSFVEIESYGYTFLFFYFSWVDRIFVRDVLEIKILLLNIQFAYIRLHF